MRTRLPIIALLVLAVAVGLHLFRKDDSATSEGVTPEVPEEQAAEAEPGGTLPEAAGAAQDALSQRNPAEAGAGEVPAGPADQSAAEPVDFEAERLELAWLERYDGLDVKGLRAKLDSLEARYIAERDQALEDRFTLGQFETYSPGDPPPPLPEVDPDGPALISSTRTGTDPNTLRIEAHVVNLLPKEYGALYEMKAEVDWLKAKIGL